MKVSSILCFLLTACASAPRPPSPQLCPSGGIEPATLITLTDQPKPIELLTPPIPIPSSVAGRRASIRVVVDTAGRVMRDSVIVCGLPDERYARRLADLVADIRFRPRQLSGRLVVAPALLVYDF